jgi:hypothetical protein
VNPFGLSVGFSDPAVAAFANTGSDAGKQAAPSSPVAFAEVLTEVEAEATVSNELPTLAGLPSEQRPRTTASEDAPKASENSDDIATTDAVALSYALVITMPQSDQAIAAPEVTLVETPEQSTDDEQAGATIPLEIAGVENRQTPLLKQEKDRKKSEPVIVASMPVALPQTSLPTLPTDSNTPQPKPDSAPTPQADTTRIGLGALPVQSVALTQNAPVVMEARITPKTAAESPKTDNADSETIQTIKESSHKEISLAGPVIKAQSPDEYAHKEGREGSGSPDERRVQTQSASVFNVQAERVQPESEPIASTSRVVSPDITRQPYIALNDNQPVKAEHTPLKQMDLRIPDANGDVVVRLQERAGSVHVSVRTNDSVVANNIQDRLPELTRTLDRQGFEAETWTPKHAVTATREVAEAAVRTESDYAAHQISHSGMEHPGALQTESAQAESERQDGHRKPGWQEELYKRPRRSSEDNFKEYL